MNEIDDFYTSETSAGTEQVSAPVFDDASPIKTVQPVKQEELVVGEDEDVQPASYTLSADLLEGMDLVVEGDDEDDNEGTLYSPEERLSALADTLMSCCVGKKSISKHALDRMLRLPSPNVFRNENFVLYSVLFNMRGRLKLIDLDEEFIKFYLNRNRKILINNPNQIDINAYGEIDGSAELGYIGGTIKHYRRLCSMDDCTEVEFETVLEKYLIEFKALEAEKVFRQAQVILTDGMTIGRKKYFGFEDSQSFVKRKLAEIEGIVSMEKGSGFTNAREMLLEEKSAKKSYKIGDFGNLTKLNDVYGGIYTGMFYQVIAPPKTGKSKFATRVAHTCSVVYGNNITVWAPEGGNDGFLAQLRAVHFDYIYNTNVDATERKYGVDQDVILHDKFPTEELRQLELSSKLDLATNEDYGSIDFIDQPFEVETFLDDIETSVKSNNSVLIVLDYLQLIGSAHNKSEREAVSDAYKRLLAFCKLNNVSVITPGQYKQETFDKLMEMKSTDSADMRTAGGVSSEVIRTPDIIFAFWATTQDIANNTMKILSMPCRFNKPFPEIKVYVDLGTCQFISVDE